MKLKSVEIENYRAIEKIDLQLHPQLTVLHGDNAHGKTSILNAIAVGLGSIPTLLPDVSGIAFLKTDRRVTQVKLKTPDGVEHVVEIPIYAQMQVELMTADGFSWRRTMGSRGRRAALRELKEAIENIVNADRAGVEPLDLPIVTFYDTDRAVFDQPRHRRGFKTEFSRYAALEGALSARTNFGEFFKWFYARENKELREQKARRDFDFRLKDLNAVRRAIMSMIPRASEPHTELNPLRFMVSLKSEPRKEETLSLDQLSGGYRIVLALAADLARRMAQGNPHHEDPLNCEAIVLIDEVELHLHPSWQQRILDDLVRTFPNTQFIVSTHSPQVLTTVRPEHIVSLRREGGRIVAGEASAATFGAEAGDVLSTEMGVGERPRNNNFVKQLEKYMRLVGDGRGESENAVSLRRKLESLSPRDPGLDRADIEIRRRKLLKRMGKSQ